MTSDPTFRSDFDVELIDSMASDDSVVRSALVSTQGVHSKDAEGSRGLINFLVRSKHGSPFEHNAFTWYVSAPIFVFREFQRHRIACLTGDTKIYFESDNLNGRWKTIEQHHKHWHEGVRDSLGRVRKLQSVRQAKVRSFEEITLRDKRSRVLDVVKSGVKPVFQITTHRGFKVTASEDHFFYGPEGWVKLKDITPGCQLYVQGRVSRSGYKSAVPKPLRQGIQVWVSHIKNEILKRDNKRCARCGSTEYKKNEYRIDHIKPVITHLELALSKDNLQILCPPCDRSKTNGEQILASRPKGYQVVSPDVVVSVVSGGEQLTYDLVLEGPYHNFLANGVVCHNSYNEESGRYRELAPVFYSPPEHRKLVQVGKAGEYSFDEGTEFQRELTEVYLRQNAEAAYHYYRELLGAGIAKEVARMVLPVSIYSSMYVTMNARALMNFLSLRVREDDSAYPSYPQWEIEQVARMMEEDFARLMPLTHGSFVRNGRVQP